MTCEQVLDQLPDYSLGTLSEVEAAAVQIGRASGRERA